MKNIHINMKTKITIGVIVALIVVGIAVYALRPTTQQKVGAIGLSDSSNFTAIGLGTNSSYMVTYGNKVSMTPSSGVPCSFTTPNATTTITMAGVLLTSATVATTTYWELTSATSATATTTLITNIGQETASGGFGWSYSTANTILAPNTYVNVGVQSSSTAQLANIGGECVLEVQTI